MPWVSSEAENGQESTGETCPLHMDVQRGR
jgi:hypothetical protein